MIIGYGFKRNETDLRNAGAKKVFIDTEKSRPVRARMMKDAGLREGDTLLVLHLNDLAGSGKASRVFIDRVKDLLDVTVKVAPGDWATGTRPRKFSPTPEQDASCREIWLNPWTTTASKLVEIVKIMGHPVARGGPNYRYGTPDKPK